MPNTSNHTKQNGEICIKYISIYFKDAEEVKRTERTPNNEKYVSIIGQMRIYLHNQRD